MEAHAVCEKLAELSNLSDIILILELEVFPISLLNAS